MTTLAIPGFAYDRISGTDRVDLCVAHGGQGPPIVLLHGFPQTHLMWNAVAQELSRDYTVIAPDLRGYGDSDKPHETSSEVYSKRTMAADVVEVAAQMGHEQFAVIGHDRGALVSVRAGLDHPDTITHIGILDVLPTMDTWDVLHGVEAKVAWHLYLMAQPKGLPEKMIKAVAEEFFASFLDAWDPTGTTFSSELREHYLRASSSAVPSIVADYRATAGIDLDMDRADRANGRQLTMPVAVISQDWGSQLGFDPTVIWEAWAADFVYEPIDAGHFMAEENPAHIAGFVRQLLAR
ncbi:alpha/beta hydrolase [Rhodococcus sp. G-MC3]|uniref:alpha/beta fold hydrolase n=1 Tax=Rhodococcus sp. G-MC3 TaxID=3046209 RepID=UPI0024BACEB5|nr:alpha/beta hydrolase [Rhodococcus sp. G-MC3]MDJ0393691.1 alpha/beta hydrolase [Rhodococcus sp. G-MC3]